MRDFSASWVFIGVTLLSPLCDLFASTHLRSFNYQLQAAASHPHAPCFRLLGACSYPRVTNGRHKRERSQGLRIAVFHSVTPAIICAQTRTSPQALVGSRLLYLYTKIGSPWKLSSSMSTSFQNILQLVLPCKQSVLSCNLVHRSNMPQICTWSQSLLTTSDHWHILAINRAVTSRDRAKYMYPWVSQHSLHDGRVFLDDKQTV
ncbi:hypothetical protein BDR03DRAFT_93351 [Suillus americanus]|nr:hypothetical protein BDR03DRAFT_93351 [Suillus americanus]